jgi:hypothetical protein
MPSVKPFDEIQQSLVDSLHNFSNSNDKSFFVIVKSGQIDEWVGIAEKIILEGGWTVEDYKAELLRRI